MEKRNKKTTGPIWNDKYKQKMCRNWEKSNTCPYGVKCQYAHGDAELSRWRQKKSKESSPSTTATTTIADDDEWLDIVKLLNSRVFSL